MKAFGLPRKANWKFYSKGDMQEYGIKGEAGHNNSKRTVRRHFKKAERARIKLELRAF